MSATYSMLLAFGGVSTSYTFDPTLFQSPYGSGVYSQPLTLSNYFSTNVLPNGAQFTVTGQILETSWGYNSPYTWTLTRGTDQITSTTPYAFRKQFFMRAEYAGDVVRMYGFYSGDSTSFPNGRVTIIAINIV